MPLSMSARAAGVATLFALFPLAAVGCESSTGSHADVQVDRQMSGRLTESPHMTLTPVRAADGFRPFAPNVKRQNVLHYTRYTWAARAMFGFDPAKPTSLLYRREPDGALKLIGAMYTAPQRASLDDLDRRVPLSIARWHLHTNVCIPRFGGRDRWTETRDGQPVFGPLSPIATRQACDAVGGRFLPKIFGWMVHANVLEGDPAAVWGMAHDDMGHEHHHES